MDVLSGTYDKYAYNLDLITFALKHDGLWGGFRVIITTSDHGHDARISKGVFPLPIAART